MSFEQEYYESASFWEGEMLHDEANKKRIEFTSSYIPEDVKSLVDVGCGNGVFLNFLNKTKPDLRLLGIERSTVALSYVQTEKLQGDISSLPLADRGFDCVSCLEVIEHLPLNIYETALKELARVSGKYIIVSVPYNEVIEESFNQCPSCKSIFNLELHLRRYMDDDIKHLFDKYGFACQRTDTFGESYHYKGHYQFRKLFYPEQFYRWRSPVCPICGYKKEPLEIQQNAVPLDKIQTKISSKQKLISSLSWLPKKIWPKEKRCYWIIGLYKRV